MIITTSLDRDSQSAETKNFISAFEKVAGYKADMVAASGHTAAMVAIAAMRKTGVEDPVAIRDAMAAITLQTATGKISFNALGEVRKDVQVQVVKDGLWRHFSLISDDKLLAPPDL